MTVQPRVAAKVLPGIAAEAAAPDAPMRIMAVADEPFVLDRLRTLLQSDDVVLSTAIWRSNDVRAQIAARRPDVILMDTVLGDQDAFAFLASLAGEHPVVAFLAPDHEAAALAYEAGAVDYLVKPLDAARVRRMLARARDELARRDLRRRVVEMEHQLAEQAAASCTALDGLWVRGHGNEWLRVAVDAIDWAIVQDDYVCLSVSGREHLLRTSLDRMLTTLGRPDLVRIHRAIAVASDRVAFAAANRAGAIRVVLRDGRSLPVGRIHARRLPWPVRPPPPR